MALYEKSREGNSLIYKITVTANETFDTELILGATIKAISIQARGNFGGGTLRWFASIGAWVFSPFGLASVSAPDTRTVVSTTVQGTWNVPKESLAMRYLRLQLSGATAPNLVIDISLMMQ